MDFASCANHLGFQVADFAVASFFQGINIHQMSLFTQSQLFRNVLFWNSYVLVVTRSAIYFEQTPDNVPSKLKRTPSWMTFMNEQPGILYCDMKTEATTTFWYVSIPCIYLRFDLDGQYLPSKYYICGQHKACLQKLLSFPFNPIFQPFELVLNQNSLMP